MIDHLLGTDVEVLLPSPQPVDRIADEFYVLVSWHLPCSCMALLTSGTTFALPDLADTDDALTATVGSLARGSSTHVFWVW